MRSLVLFLALAPAAAAQRYEFGFTGGGAFSTLPGVGGAPAVTAGFGPGFAAGATLGHDLYPRLSGEIRYLFGLQQARLRSGAAAVDFSAQSHALDYRVVLHTRPRSSPVRPYAMAGAGMKIYNGTGTETAWRPLMQYAWLTRTRDIKPLFTFGAGVKIRLGPRLQARFEVQDQLTPFPTRVITPAPGMSLGSWLHDFVPLAGLSWLF
jgi:hypothetical protein